MNTDQGVCFLEPVSSLESVSVTIRSYQAYLGSLSDLESRSKFRKTSRERKQYLTPPAWELSLILILIENKERFCRYLAG